MKKVSVPRGCVRDARSGRRDCRAGGRQGSQHLQLVRLYRRLRSWTDFTKETGIKVVYDVYDATRSSRPRCWPAARATTSSCRPTATCAPDRGRRLPEARQVEDPESCNIWPEIYERLATYDPGNEYAVNYMWGTTGIGYNEGKINERMADAPVNSLDMIFKPEVAAKFADCGIYVLEFARRRHPGRAQLSRPRPDSKDPGRSAEGRGPAR